MGVDSIWTWDHFFPLYGDPDAEHFEGWTLLSAMAADTSRAKFGMLVTGNNYRNPELLADMARTLDHVSDGRHVPRRRRRLVRARLRRVRLRVRHRRRAGCAQLGQELPRIKARLAALNPPPVGDLPILIGGGGEKVTLRLVAEHADAWNTFGPPANFAHKSAVLDEWCAQARPRPVDDRAHGGGRSAATSATSSGTSRPARPT